MHRGLVAGLRPAPPSRRLRPGLHPTGAALLAALLACARPAPVDGAPRGAAAAPAAAALAEGTAAWPDRGQPARQAAALDAFRRAARARPGDAALEVALARAEAFRALAAGGAGAEARAAHEASARAAERALAALAPAFGEALRAGRAPAEAAALVPAAGAEPLYWLALGHMGVAQASGHAAVLAVKDQVRPLMARAAELDEAVDEGGPLRALGAWSAMLPVAAGGGVAEARARFARAAERFPDEAWRRVLEARTLAVLLQDRAAFERLLGEVLGTAPAAAGPRAPEAALAHREAQALLDKKGSLF
jgi:hypothetical protein